MFGLPITVHYRIVFGGFRIVTDARFVEICQNVETLVELKQQLYWMSFGIEREANELFGETQLGKPKIPESSNISDDGVLGYDPMQALLERQYRSMNLRDI